MRAVPPHLHAGAEAAGPRRGTRRAALEFYAHYYGVRYAARLLRVNHQSIINWVDEACERARDSGEADELTTMVVARREADLQNRQYRLESKRYLETHNYRPKR